MAEKKQIMKNFSSSEEDLIRKFLFTNPHGDVAFLYPQSLVAGEELSPLMSAYSRTHVPFQDRTLTFLDTQKPEETRRMLEYIPKEIELFRHLNGTLKISKRTKDFTNEYTLGHGHNSIKEETPLFGYSENHSDITAKKISGHPRNNPQAKSTRYLSYGNVLNLSLEDIDLKRLPNSDEALQYIEYMNKKYLSVTNELAQKVQDHKDTASLREYLLRPDMVDKEVASIVENKKRIDEEFVADEKFILDQKNKYIKSLTDDFEVKKQLDKFVIDYSRAYLPAATKTSMGFSIDGRTLEEVLTDMISSPRLEDQERGKQIWAEAKKIAPILLGDQTHVKVDPWKVYNETELRTQIQEKYGNLFSKDSTDKHIVKVLTPKDIEMYTDRFNAGLVVAQYTDASITDIMKGLKDSDVKDVLKEAHKGRGKYDIIHPAISHGGLMVEMLMGYHGYRDIFRHRKGSRTTQLLTTVHGFEVPEIFKTFEIDKQYSKDMDYASKVFESTKKHSPQVAEKIVPFGALVRALHSWQPDQIGYVANLRSKFATGNLSYVYMVRDMAEQFAEKMPLTGQYLKYDKSDYPAHIWKKGLNWYDSEVRGK